MKARIIMVSGCQDCPYLQWASLRAGRCERFALDLEPVPSDPHAECRLPAVSDREQQLFAELMEAHSG